MPRSVLRFLRFAVTPVPAVADWFQVALAIAIAAGLATRGPELGLPLVAAFAFLLGLVAGVRLQAEKDRWETPSFDFEAELEPVDWEHWVVNGRPYKHQAIAWVNVRNTGLTSQFAAHVPEVSGVPANWGGGDYRIIEAMWERQPSTSTLEIPRGTTRRLMLAAVLREPRAFWFHTVIREGETGAGHQWLLSQGYQAEIDFTLEIVNVGARDQVARKAGRITVPIDPSQATFTLSAEPD